MVVIALEKCPASLRGDLTKWLQEISYGVYVGHISARVREKLWMRICEEAKSGRATMVFSAKNEQKYDFRVHNTTWEPIDFDGIKLMMRPSPARMESRGKSVQKPKMSINRRRRYPSNRESTIGLPAAYVVFDIETTGLDPENDEIIEIGAIKVINGTERNCFNCVVKPSAAVSKAVLRLTKISPVDLENGTDIERALEHLLSFMGSYPLIAHNAEFDLTFLQNALTRYDLDELENEVIDTLALARSRFPNLNGYRLMDLANHFGIPAERFHRALSDARTTNSLLIKLNEK